MGHLKIRLDLDHATGQEQLRLQAEMKKAGGTFGADRPDVFLFHDSTIDERRVIKATTDAIERAGLAGRIALLGAPTPIGTA
jgi:hypothetical protein